MSTEERADFQVGDSVSMKETMLGLRQGDVGEVVGVQQYMVGVAFEDHPQAALWLDKDLLDRIPESEEEAESEGGGGDDEPGPSVPTPVAASLLRHVGYTDERGWERNSDGVREHRRVMEEKLDRPLKHTEDVHHKNEDKSDNRPENLEVVDHGDHTSEHKSKEACLLESLGIELDAQSSWWRDLSHEQQVEYVKQHPRTKLKPQKPEDVPKPGTPEPPEGKAIETDEAIVMKVGGYTREIPKGRKWEEKLDHLPDDLKKAFWDGDVPKPERRELVDKIKRKFIEHVPPVPENERPVAIFTMGGPASGKSSALTGLSDEQKRLFVWSDPDAVKGELPEYREAIGDPEYLEETGKPDTGVSAKNAAAMAHEESSTIAKQIADEALETRRHCVIDGTGKNLKGMLEKIQRYKDAGYYVQLVMPDIDEDEAAFRARKRAERTGRWVPEEIVRGAYAAIPGNFDEIAALADDYAVFDMQREGKPVLVADKAGGEENVYDPEWKRAFDEKAQASRARRKKPETKPVELPLAAYKTLDSGNHHAILFAGGSDGSDQEKGPARQRQAARARPDPRINSGCNQEVDGANGSGGRRAAQAGTVLQGRRRDRRDPERLARQLLAGLGIEAGATLQPSHNPSSTEGVPS